MAKEKKPKAKKQKLAKVAKPKWVKILSDELERLRADAALLPVLISAQKKADAAEMLAKMSEQELEEQKETTKALKSAAVVARSQVNELVRGYDRDLPLFPKTDKPAEKPADKPAESAAVDPLSLVTIECLIKPEGNDGLAVEAGKTYHPTDVGVAGVFVGESALMANEYKAADEASQKLLDEYRVGRDKWGRELWLEFLTGKLPAPAAPEPAKPEDESWKSLPVGRLSLTSSHEEYLIACGIKTLGEFTAFQTEHGDFWEKDLRVNGEPCPRGFVAAVVAGWDGFWKTWQPAAA